MTTANETNAIKAILDSLTPHLGAEARRQAQALKSLFELFPGKTASEIEKEVRNLQAVSQDRTATQAQKLAGLADRARTLVAGSSTESAAKFLADLGKLTAADLKEFGHVVGLPLAGTKKSMLEVVGLWIESRGHVMPASAQTTKVERARQQAQAFAGDLADRAKAGPIDLALRDEIIRKAEAANRDLDAEAFRAFANLLGIPASGAKKKVLQDIKNFADKAAGDYEQTKS
jgi:hypothetical protein